MAVPSQVPVRYPSGVSTDPVYGPLANYGVPNQFMYHTWYDDFNLLNATYTATKTGNGTIASTALDGGRLLFTTNTSTPVGTDICSIQLPAAGFVRPAADAGKKMFFLTRVQLSSISNAMFVLGLIQTTTTPFTVTDGIYFSKATGAANNLTLTSMIGSVATSVTIPTNAYTMANATDIDLGFYVDRSGNILAFVGSQLVGWLPQSSPQSSGGRGPVAALTAPSITTAALNPTIAFRSGTAASSTMTVDFAMAAKER